MVHHDVPKLEELPLLEGFREQVGNHRRSPDQVADIFTKAVEKAKFTRVRDFMMNIHSSLRVQLESGLITAVGASHRMMCSLLRRL